MLFKMEESGYATLKTFYMQQGSIDWYWKILEWLQQGCLLVLSIHVNLPEIKKGNKNLLHSITTLVCKLLIN